MNIPVHFEPRDYQRELIQALEWGVKMAVICWARRGGKDFTCFAYAIKKMIERPMNVVLVFPKKDQGKQAFWENVENDGFKTIDHIPKSLVLRQDNTDMVITLKNGSTFRVLGANDPEALRGANGALYIFTEFVDIPKAALDVIRPIVRANGGQIIINSTPKIDGISGASFERLFKKALNIWEKGDKKQFASLVTADRYMAPEELEEARLESIEENGNDFWYRQEYMCDFGQASSTSYYGEALALAEKAKRIGYYPYDPHYPVYSVWDWGMSDNTAIGFFQFFKVAGEPTIRIIDAYETNNIGIKQLTAFVKSKPYNMAWHFFPHDISVRDSDAVKRIEKFRDEGLINSSILPREPVEDGIERVVSAFKDCVVFNETPTKKMREKMKLYKRKWNPKTGDYVGPQHDSSSHYSDMGRYLCKAVEEEFDQKTCEHYFSQVSMEADSGTEEYAETSFYQPAV